MCASERTSEAVRRPRRAAQGVCVGMALLLAAAAAPAQQAPSREQEQIRRLRQQVQQLQQQLTSQQEATARSGSAQKEAAARSEAELRRLRGTATGRAAQLQALETELETARQERGTLQARVQQLQGELGQRQQELQTSLAGGSDLRRRLGFRETQLAELAERHVRQAQGLQQCIVNNQGLKTLGDELLSRYAGKGFSEVLQHQEPFLQTRRVSLENLVQGYQDKLDDLALKASRPAGAADPGTAVPTSPAAAPAPGSR
jgi:chromosome segregation ATPase